MDTKQLGKNGLRVSAIGLGCMSVRDESAAIAVIHRALELGMTFLDTRPRADDWRRNNPRFQGEAFTRNVALADRVREMAAAKRCTPAQLALAWLLTHPDVVPIPGTSSVERVAENAGAASIRLTREEIDEIERRSPKGAAVGERYHASGAALLNG
jgi:aryl-alcohol dehydrogenase-like predicted oxidoreductase